MSSPRSIHARTHPDFGRAAGAAERPGRGDADREGRGAGSPPDDGRRGAGAGAGAAADPRLDALRKLARALDAAIVIPGTRIRIGLDPLLGLLPGIGDVAAAAIAAYAILVAWRMGAPASVLARLVGNVAFDALLGTVPVVGDVADVAYRANVRNVRLLERWAERPAETRRASRLSVLGLIAALVLVTVGGVWLALVAWQRLMTAR